MLFVAAVLLPKEADQLFLQLMIPHHRAAIPMAEAVLEETNDPAVEEFAGAIAASQRAEIEVMQEMLQERGAPPVENGNPMPMDMGGEHAGEDHGE